MILIIMMKKTLKSLFIIFLFTFCRYNIAGQEKNREIVIDVSEVIIPEGIVYNKAADDINNQAINYLIELVNGYKIYNNPPDMIMIGPRMWISLKKREEIAGSPTIPVSYIMPWNGEIIELEGAAVRSQERTRYVVGLFKNLFNLESITIRKLSENELKYFWVICSWDLEEPLFAIEGENIGTFVFDFNNNEIFFIENITDIR